MGIRTRVATCALALAVPVGAAAQQPAAPEPPPKTWEGTAGAGLSFTQGNSDTATYNVAFDVTHTPKARNVIKTTGLYMRGEQDDDLTVNRTAVVLRDEYGLTSRLLLFGQAGYLHDTFKLIDYLIAPTAGLGFKIVNTDPTKFLVDAGAGGVWEKNPGTDVHASGAVTSSERLAHDLTPTASIKHALAGLWKTDDFGDALFTVSAGLATKISEKVQLSIDVLETYKTKPPTAATKKSDIAFVTAIAAKF